MLEYKFPFNDADFDDLALLIRQPSFEQTGQIQKLQLIESMIRRRMRGGPNAKTYRMEHVEAKDGFYTLVVRVGEKPRNSLFTVLVPSHIDTVTPSDSWKKPFKLRFVNAENGKEPDTLRGLGVNDMQAAVMNSIQLASTLALPPGMTVYFAFTPDEELHSRGAKGLIRHWRHWDDVDAVYSQEIGPCPIDDDVPHIIAGRRGMLKGILEVEVDASEAHAAEDDGALNAEHILADLQTEWLRQVNSGAGLSHELMGREHLQFTGEGGETGSGDLSTVVEASKYWKLFVVPPHTLKTALEAQVQCCQRIAQQRGWVQNGVTIRLARVKDARHVSYPPYVLDPSDPIVRAVEKHVVRIYGRPPKWNGGPSNADENLYARGREEGKVVIGSTYNGGGAHGPNEWVSRRSVERAREVARSILEYAFETVLKGKR